MSSRFDRTARLMNGLLRTDLGDNPRYEWRWSDDLLHVMDIMNSPGRTALRPLLPNHLGVWVVCALVEVNQRDGSLYSTGSYAWVPVSSANSGPVALPQGESPSLGATQAVIDAIRQRRSKSDNATFQDWEKATREREKQHWTNIYDQIRDAATAFCNVPGKKGAVSFGGADATLIN